VEIWLCPACLAPGVAGFESCIACSAPLRIGERFVVLEPLASHGSARTLGGVEQQSGAPVILKTLSVSGMTDWKQLELFQRGIAVLRGLSHPGIPRHLGDGQLSRGGETIYWWAQERVPGRTLAEGLSQGQRWTEARARALTDAVLEILEHLQGYSPPILHRDLKPSNVMERPDGSFAVIDFDLVKDTIDPEGTDTTALGTVGYAPLEQLMGRAVPASDLYGLGATLVALLSRKSPADLLDADASRLDFRPHVRVSEAFAGFLDRLVEPRASRRPADARAARVLLRGLAGAGEGAALARSEAPPEMTAEARQLARARTQLLRVLQRRASPRSTALAPTGPTLPIIATATREYGVVIVQTPLAQDHPAPRWILPVRLAILAGSAVALPAKGMVLGVLLLAIWVVSGFVVRYRVELPPGRALFKGGLGNTGVPGTYHLRRRWLESAYSIPTATLHLDWRPVPTRLEQGEHHAWLELALDLWVEPCRDDMGQFRALLNYHLWQAHPRTATKKLRDDVIAALVEHVAEAGLLARASAAPVRLEHDDDVQLALATGLREVGLELLHATPRRLALVPRTDDLETDDRLWIDARPRPES
jgi:hypothetical protein